jgi:AcrR family transcriptional regulator
VTSRPAHSEQRRQQILNAAGLVITQRGICDTRIADVAEVAATSTGLILYYFESKDHLLAEALTHAEDEFYLQVFHGISRIDDPREQLTYLIARSCPDTSGTDEVDADWTLWLELWARSLHDDAVGRKRAALDRRWRSTIADVVRTGQRQGVFAAVDPVDFALELAALMDGLAVQVVLDDTEVDSDRMRRILLGLAMRRLEFELDDLPFAMTGG